MRRAQGHMGRLEVFSMEGSQNRGQLTLILAQQ